MYRVWTFHFYQIWNNSTGRFSLTSGGHVTRFYYGWKYFFCPNMVMLYTIGKLFLNCLEYYKKFGLKMKCSRDITIWNLSSDVTWPFSNQNISRGLHFHTLFLIWFWISLTRAFKRYIMTYFDEEKKFPMGHVMMTSYRREFFVFS